MNDTSYEISSSDLTFLKEIGRFLQTTRIKQNLTQDEVANRAAISRSTLSLTERGENISMLNLIKILRVLDALYVLNQFKGETTVSPLLLAKAEEQKQKRATKVSGKDNKSDLGW